MNVTTTFNLIQNITLKNPNNYLSYPKQLTQNKNQKKKDTHTYIYTYSIVKPIHSSLRSESKIISYYYIFSNQHNDYIKRHVNWLNFLLVVTIRLLLSEKTRFKPKMVITSNTLLLRVLLNRTVHV